MEDDHLPKAGTSDDVAKIISSKDLGATAKENPRKEEAKNLEFSEDEKTLILRMHNLVGDRWSLIAGRIPGRSAEEIEKYWNSRNSTNQINATINLIGQDSKLND